MKIYLTRHGRTVGNEKRIHEGGRLHGKLSELGKEQVKKLANRLKNEKFDYIYSSDLRRARQTTKAIIKFHSKVPIEFTKDLREADVGSFTGKLYDEVSFNNPPKNLEENEALQKRALKIIDRIYQKHKNDTILIVAHSYFNRALIAAILRKKISEIEIQQDNTCVNIIDIYEDKKHKIHLLNCINHLEA